ncbi:hypothetical protein RBB50_009597 [Rhinocladiella similis]
MSPEEALRRASRCKDQLDMWYSQHVTLPFTQSVTINGTFPRKHFTVVLAYYGIAISIQRALFTCAGGTSYYDLDREKLLFQDIFSVLNSLLEKELVGVWLSYCKCNLATVGTFILTVLLSSTDPDVLEARKTILDDYQRLLQQLSGKFPFAALPRLRLNLLAERFSVQISNDEFWQASIDQS